MRATLLIEWSEREAYMVESMGPPWCCGLWVSREREGSIYAGAHHAARWFHPWSALLSRANLGHTTGTESAVLIYSRVFRLQFWCFSFDIEVLIREHTEEDWLSQKLFHPRIVGQWHSETGVDHSSRSRLDTKTTSNMGERAMGRMMSKSI